MSHNTLNLSPKSWLSPLTIPDAAPDKDLAPESSCSASKLFSHCASFKTNCLLSPVNPATWKGASSRARFGLDIGGTLCKVVYFEPLDESDPETPSVKSEFGRRGNDVAEKPLDSDNCCCPSIHQVSECREQLSSGLLNAPLDCVSNSNKSNLEGSVGQLKGRDDWYDGPLDDNGDYFSSSKTYSRVRKLWVSSHDPVLIPGRGTLYFKCFETWRMEEFLFLTKEHALVTGRRALGATGGGARKFGGQFLEIAGLQLSRADELKSLVRGIDFLMKYAQHESFEYPKAASFQGGVIQRPLKSPEDSSDESLSEEEGSAPVVHLDKHVLTLKKTALVDRANVKSGWDEDQPLYPYLVVNIGSGVSILLVESPEHFKRVGGTSLGGSTFFGLTSILTGCTSFKEAIDLAALGDSTEIDMLVGDIYGGDYLEMGLAATTVASSFGKLVQPERRAEAAKKPQHLAKAALLMITNNIGALAKLHAQATGVHHVLFTGSFMHGNKLAMRLLSVAMEFWSEGQLKAVFLRHEGHAGAMGALLNALDPSNKTDALLLS